MYLTGSKENECVIEEAKEASVCSSPLHHDNSNPFAQFENDTMNMPTASRKRRSGLSSSFAPANGK